MKFCKLFYKIDCKILWLYFIAKIKNKKKQIL